MANWRALEERRRECSLRNARMHAGRSQPALARAVVISARDERPADVPSRLSTVMWIFAGAHNSEPKGGPTMSQARRPWRPVGSTKLELMPCMRRRTNPPPAEGDAPDGDATDDDGNVDVNDARAGPPPSLPPAGLPTGAPVPNPVRSLEGMRAAAAATHVEPTSPRGAIRPKPVPKDLPACREISRMDEIIELHGECVARWHAGVRGFGTRVFTHKDCAEHAANTCCCAYEREVTTRKLRGARDALHEASAKMLLWQSRMAAAARLRHLRKRGYPAFRAWRNRSSGTAPQRKVLAMAVKVWSKRVVAKAHARWRETCRYRRRARNLLSIALASTNRRWFTRWRDAAHAAARIARITDRVVRRLARAKLAAAIDAWRARAREFISLRRRAVLAASRLGRTKLAAAFGGWRDGVAWRKRTTELVRKVAKRVVLRDVAAAWRQWRAVASRGRDRRYKTLMAASANHAAEREQWLLAAETREKELIRGFHEQMEKSRAEAEEEARWALRRVVDGANEVARRLEREAAEARAARPKTDKSLASVRTKERSDEAAMTVTNAKKAKAKKERVRTEVKDRIEQLRRNFDAAVETAEARLKKAEEEFAEEDAFLEEHAAKAEWAERVENAERAAERAGKIARASAVAANDAKRAFERLRERRLREVENAEAFVDEEFEAIRRKFAEASKKARGGDGEENRAPGREGGADDFRRRLAAL